MEQSAETKLVSASHYASNAYELSFPQGSHTPLLAFWSYVGIIVITSDNITESQDLNVIELARNQYHGRPWLRDISASGDWRLCSRFAIVVRGGEGGVHGPPPGFSPCQGRQLEIQCLPKCIQDEIQILRAGHIRQGKGQAVGIITPIRLADPHSVPGEFSSVDTRRHCQSGLKERMITIEPDHSADKPIQLLILVHEPPIKPGRFIVLAISVVVAFLGSTSLISQE